MQLFDFDPGRYVTHLAQHGWVHVRSGVTSDFLEHLRNSVRRRRTEQSLAGSGIRGEKDQFLYDTPPGADLVGEMRDLTAKLCGLERDGFVVSERHIKVYASDASPSPTAHKDRLASQVSIGVSIEVPEGSYLELYPAVERTLNPHLTADLNRTLPPNEHPDTTLREQPSVKIHDRPGDVIVFPGSSVWHRRCNSANTANLYLKCNDFDCDPLAEDPSTAARTTATAQSLRDSDRLRGAVPVLSRRLEWTGLITSRDGNTRAVAKLWDSPFTVISEVQLKVLDELTNRRSLPSAADTSEAVLDLAARGIVDLVNDEV